MPHESRIAHCTGPADPHALDGIAVQPRAGEFDRPCPECQARGMWNREFDLASQRSKRSICAKCDGHGWIETGDDLVPSHQIALSEEGHPQWVVQLSPSDDRE